MGWATYRWYVLNAHIKNMIQCDRYILALVCDFSIDPYEAVARWSDRRCAREFLAWFVRTGRNLVDQTNTHQTPLFHYYHMYYSHCIPRVVCHGSYREGEEDGERSLRRAHESPWWDVLVLAPVCRALIRAKPSALLRRARTGAATHHSAA